MERATIYSRKKRMSETEKYRLSLKALDGLISFSHKVKMHGLWLSVEHAERLATLATIGLREMEER